MFDYNEDRNEGGGGAWTRTTKSGKTIGRSSSGKRIG
jgi:hypothetical protein